MLICNHTAPLYTPHTGSHSPLASLPVRQYMDAAVVPTLREGLRALNDARPPDALLFLSEYLLEARARIHEENKEQSA
mgnify:CR=1 FL=1